MIFYFSGTGNSRWAAEAIATELKERLIFIPDAIRQDSFCYELSPSEKLGFIFPCYAWGLPRFVAEFIKCLSVRSVGYLFYICTCGDDTGLLNEEFCSLVSAKGWTCHLGWDIVMPESYVNLPGFDVDSHEKEISKLTNAKVRLSQAVDDILDQREGDFQNIPGTFPRLKSTLLRWFFNKYLMSPSKFHTSSQCTSCSLCAKSCPLHNITMTVTSNSEPSLPKWSSSCAMCMRCYHTCPQHAINWGRWTSTKGQYLHRDIPHS